MEAALRIRIRIAPPDGVIRTTPGGVVRMGQFFLSLFEKLRCSESRLCYLCSSEEPKNSFTRVEEWTRLRRGYDSEEDTVGLSKRWLNKRHPVFTNCSSLQASTSVLPIIRTARLVPRCVEVKAVSRKVRNYLRRLGLPFPALARPLSLSSVWPRHLVFSARTHMRKEKKNREGTNTQVRNTGDRVNNLQQTRVLLCLGRRIAFFPSLQG